MWGERECMGRTAVSAWVCEGLGVLVKDLYLRNACLGRTCMNDTVR